MTFAQSSSKQIINTGGNPSLPFSPAVKADGLIYVAGTLGTNASGAIAKATSRRRPKQTLDNITATLKAARLEPGERRQRDRLPAQRRATSPR